MPDYDLDAERAAREWLALADVADSAGTWAASASLFRNAVPEDEWARALTAARAPLGAVVARKLRAARAATELPGAPDGEYVVLEFDTQFERKRAAVETVTPMRDADGGWRVSGYYIR
jgi:Protein of unknown function (DUF4019)